MTKSAKPLQLTTKYYSIDDNQPKKHVWESRTIQHPAIGREVITKLLCPQLLASWSHPTSIHSSDLGSPTSYCEWCLHKWRHQIKTAGCFNHHRTKHHNDPASNKKLRRPGDRGHALVKDVEVDCWSQARATSPPSGNGFAAPVIQRLGEMFCDPKMPQN